MNVKRELTFAPLMETLSVLRILCFMKKQAKNRGVRIVLSARVIFVVTFCVTKLKSGHPDQECILKNGYLSKFFTKISKILGENKS